MTKPPKWFKNHFLNPFPSFSPTTFLWIESIKMPLLNEIPKMRRLCELTIALDLPQGDRGGRDGWGTEVSRQGLWGVRGHSPQIFLPEHLPPWRGAGERLSAVLEDEKAEENTYEFNYQPGHFNTKYSWMFKLTTKSRKYNKPCKRSVIILACISVVGGKGW